MNISKKILQLMTFTFVVGICHFTAIHAASTLPRSRSLDSLKTTPIKILNSTPHYILVLFKDSLNRKYYSPITLDPHATRDIPHNTTTITVLHHNYVCEDFKCLAPGMIVHISTPKIPLSDEDIKEQGSFY